MLNEAKVTNNSQWITLALLRVSMKRPAPPARKRRMLITHWECVNFRDRENICTNVGRQKVEGSFTESLLQTHLHIFFRKMSPNTPELMYATKI